MEVGKVRSFLKKATIISLSSASIMVAIDARAGTIPPPITSSFDVAISNRTTSYVPVKDGVAGEYTFDASFCDKASTAYTGLYSKTLTLTNGNSLTNRTFASATGSPGGPGSSLVFDKTTAYANGIASPGECVVVPYHIGLADTQPFQFTVSVQGNVSVTAVPLASITTTTSGGTTDSTAKPGAPAGTYSITAQFCRNAGQSTLTGMYTITNVLSPSGDNLLNRTTDGPNPNQPGGAGSLLILQKTGQYSDGALSSGECVLVPYEIGLASLSQFTFKVAFRAD